MTALWLAGWASILIGVGHVLSLPWERRLSYWVGIGPDMDRLAAVHWVLPAVLTTATAGAFAAFGLYALSAAGTIRGLPLVRPAITGIAWLYLLRAVGGTGMGGFIEDASVKELTFSTIAGVIGVLYVVGARAAYLEKGLS